MAAFVSSPPPRIGTSLIARVVTADHDSRTTNQLRTQPPRQLRRSAGPFSSPHFSADDLLRRIHLFRSEGVLGVSGPSGDRVAVAVCRPPVDMNPFPRVGKQPENGRRPAPGPAPASGSALTHRRVIMNDIFQAHGSHVLEVIVMPGHTL